MPYCEALAVGVMLMGYFVVINSLRAAAQVARFPAGSSKGMHTGEGGAAWCQALHGVRGRGPPGSLL